jgi:hypothetical protein
MVWSTTASNSPLNVRRSTWSRRRALNAAQTIQAFSDHLRQQTNLDTLTADLLRVADQTMQPTSVSLWLRPSTSTSPDERRTTPSRTAWQPITAT